jgi:hypothetical protein
MANDQIGAIERDIRLAKDAIELGNTVNRLKSNKDFKEVVMKGFFEQEAVRLVHLKGEPHMQEPDSQRSIISQMDAIASFSQYLNAIFGKARMAAASLANSEEVLAELLDEDSHEGAQ